MVGKIEKIIINVTGYEAVLLLNYEELGKIYCSVMLDNEHDPTKSYSAIEAYFEDLPSIKLEVGSLFNSNLKINYGNDIQFVDNGQRGYIQNIDKSPHALFTCRVLKILEDGMLECDLGSILNEVKVEFEESIQTLEQGDIISFSGEFALIID